MPARGKRLALTQQEIMMLSLALDSLLIDFRNARKAAVKGGAPYTVASCDETIQRYEALSRRVDDARQG